MCTETQSRLRDWDIDTLQLRTWMWHVGTVTATRTHLAADSLQAVIVRVESVLFADVLQHLRATRAWEMSQRNAGQIMRGEKVVRLHQKMIRHWLTIVSQRANSRGKQLRRFVKRENRVKPPLDVTEHETCFKHALPVTTACSETLWLLVSFHSEWGPSQLCRWLPLCVVTSRCLFE